MGNAIEAPRAEETISARHAFRAAQAFIEIWWRIGEEQSDELANILSSMELMRNGMPIDQALWHDWLDAIDRTR